MNPCGVEVVSIGSNRKIGGYSLDLKHVKINRIPQSVLNLIEGGKITILLIDGKPVAFEGSDGFSTLSGFCREFFNQII